MLYMQHFDPAHSKFSGLPIIMLTQPCSLPALTVLGHVQGARQDTFVSSVVLGACALLNVTLLYLAGLGLEQIVLGRTRPRDR